MTGVIEAHRTVRYVAEAVNLVTSRYTRPERKTKLTCASATIPCLIIASVNAYNLWNEHWEHWEHQGPLEERTQYPYQNIRTKKYFWGDGDKVSGTCAALQLNLRGIC